MFTHKNKVHTQNLARPWANLRAGVEEQKQKKKQTKANPSADVHGPLLTMLTPVSITKETASQELIHSW